MRQFYTGKNFTTAALLVVIGLVVFTWWQVNVNRHRKLTAVQVQTVLAQPVKLRPFQLIASNGPNFTEQSLQGRWAFLYLGYTHCGDVCNNAMIALGKVYEQLNLQSQSVPLILFVSIKPMQDTLTNIKNYVNSYNPHFLGLTASADELPKLVNVLGAEYVQLKTPGSTKVVNPDQLAQNGTLFLIDPTGKLHAIFTRPYTATTLINSYESVLAQPKKSTELQ